MVNLLTKWRRAERELTRELGCTPTADQIAVNLGLTDAQRNLVEKARRATQLRLESGASEGGGEWPVDAASRNVDPPDAMLEADDERQDLLRRMQRLDERERSILTLRFGLEGELPLTLKEVGRRLGVTREWVRKIEIRAVRKLDDSESPGEATKPQPEGTKSGGTAARQVALTARRSNRRRAVRSSRSAW
jgi:RNA polymerase primary sigma factor